MKLLEIKNNLVKISYSDADTITLAQFIALVDSNKSYVAQIINLKADIATNYAIGRLIFTFNDEGIVDNYDGSAPSIKAQLSYLKSDDILKLLPLEKPINMGELAQQNVMFKVDQTIFEKNLTICAEKFDNILNIVRNSSIQLANIGEKVVVIDVDHTFGEYEPIRFKRDFKLPLNAKMIDYIYENDLKEVDAASKAVIQDIFYEVQEYTKTVEGNFIPFDTFLKVVSTQYEKSNIPELALLKHKLLKYQEENVFAQTKEELDSLEKAVRENQICYIDIADVPDSLQKELIAYIHNIINKVDSYIYIFVKITNKNTDKKLLLQLINNDHIFTTTICSHNYKYLPELKQRAENIILFAPQTVQHDFASYNTLLNKLNANEFIIYGTLTQNVPFILELKEFDQNQIEVPSQINDFKQLEEPASHDEPEQPEQPEQQNDAAPEPENVIQDTITYDLDNVEYGDEQEIPEETQIHDDVVEQPDFNKTPEELSHDELVEQAVRDVDEMLYTKPEEVPSIDDITDQDTITEEDLDFIDDLGTEPQVLEEELPAESNEYEVINDFPFEEDHPLEEVPQIEDVLTDEEPLIEDIQSDLEAKTDIDNAMLDEPQPPVVPIYPSEEPVLDADAPAFEQGDMVSHPKYGKGVIEKLIKYGNKTLCSISFENIGRRLLDPAISELQKVE